MKTVGKFDLLLVQNSSREASSILRVLSCILPAAKVLSSDSGQDLDILSWNTKPKLIIADAALTGNRTCAEFWRFCREMLPTTGFILTADKLEAERLFIAAKRGGPSPVILAKPFAAVDLKKAIDLAFSNSSKSIKYVQQL